MLGSANISGSKAMHLMTGNLSHQIEHHLFPDMPSNRYKEIAPKIQDLFQRYGLSYTSGPLPKQVASAWWKVIRLSLPNRGEAAVRREVTKKAPAVSTRWRPVKAPLAAATPATEMATNS
jgi:linoleoyl-CoA desaturase